MAVLTEGVYPWGPLVSKANHTRSLAEVTIVAGQNLKAGAVIGKITTGGKYAVYSNVAVDGSETAAAVLLYAVDASAADKKAAAVVRDAEVNEGELIYADGTSAPDKAAALVDLAAAGIIALKN